MIDTHAHLDMVEDAAGAVARAREAGVTRVLTVGIDPRRWQAALELAHGHDEVRAIVGIHPHNAATDATLTELRSHLADERVVAIGEIGLDYYREYAPPARQRVVLEAQLELARELDRAVVIHSRAADDDTAAALARHEGDVVLHCFSSPALLRPALEHGWYVSFAGNVTYKNAADLRVAAAEVPSDRLLAETDAPFLAPQPVRGRPCEPAYVLHTLAELARVRGVAPEELERQIDANAARVFAL